MRNDWSLKWSTHKNLSVGLTTFTLLDLAHQQLLVTIRKINVCRKDKITLLRQSGCVRCVGLIISVSFYRMTGLACNPPFFKILIEAFYEENNVAGRNLIVVRFLYSAAHCTY